MERGFVPLISVYAAQKQKWILGNKTGEFQVRAAGVGDFLEA